jgi:CHASE3 domain sensor protein
MRILVCAAEKASENVPMSEKTCHGPRTRFWEFLEHGLLREIGFPLMMVSLVLFVAAMALLGINVSEMHRSYARVQRVNDALVQIAMVNADILRVEMIVRGYALSGDPIYNTWKDEADGNLRTRLKALTAAFSGQPEQQADFERLRGMLQEHHATWDRLMRLVPVDKTRVIAEVVIYGKAARRKLIERMLVKLREDEGSLLQQRQRAAEDQVVGAYRSAVGISTLALILGALGFAFVLPGRRARRRGEA